MAKPSPLQVRNLLVAALAAAGCVWSIVAGLPWWVSVIVGAAALLAVASAYLNRPEAK